MADTKISAMSAAAAATASTVPVVQGGVNKKVSMTGAGAAMIEAADAAAQAALLTDLLAKAGGTMTGALANSTNGAANAPALHLTGAPYAAGTATSNKALLLIETAGATSTGWGAGTLLGANAASGYTGNLFDFQINGVSKLKTSSAELVLFDAPFRAASGGGNGFQVRNSANNLSYTILDGSTGLQLCKNHIIGWSSGFQAGSDGLILSLQNGTSNVLALGGGSATPAASRISGNFGAGTNITGGALEFGTQGTGTGTAGPINFKSHAAGSSGTTLGTLVTIASVLTDRLKMASGMLLQLGNAAATEVLVCDKSIQFIDSAGVAYKVPCVAA